MIIYDRGETTVCGEGLPIITKPVLSTTKPIQQPELNKDIIEIIKKIREKLTKPSETSMKPGFKNI
jgi:hypothetical protein